MMKKKVKRVLQTNENDHDIVVYKRLLLHQFDHQFLTIGPL